MTPKKSTPAKKPSESADESCRKMPISFDPAFKAKQKAALARSEMILQRMQQEVGDKKPAKHSQKNAN